MLGWLEGRRRRNCDDDRTSAEYVVAVEMWINFPECHARTVLEAHVLAAFNLRREDFYRSAISILKEYVAAQGAEIERMNDDNKVLLMLNETLKEELQGVED